MSRKKEHGGVVREARTDKVPGLQETVLCSAVMLDAIFELLVEKGILTGEEVRDRVKKLREEAPPHVRWVQ